MVRTPESGGSAFRFLPAEVVATEKALDDAAGATPACTVVDRLADQFTNSPERAGQKPIAWKQVWNWFQNRRHAQKAKVEKSRAVASVASEAGPPAPRVATLAGTNYLNGRGCQSAAGDMSQRFSYHSTHAWRCL